MRHHKTEVIRDLLRDFLRNEGLQTPLSEHRIIEAWPEVAGPAIASYTGQIYVRNGVLHIQIRSASLRQNLMMSQTVLLARLNAAAGQTVVSRIHFF